MINVIYISYDGLTDPLGQSQVLPYINGLSKLGYHMHVISFEKKKGFYSFKEVEKLINQNTTTWYPLYYSKKPPVFSTIWDILKGIYFVKKIIRENKIQLIHCRSYISALIGLAIKRKKNIPFIFDMRGFWADERVDGGIWNLKNPIYKIIYNFFKKQEYRFCTESSAIISLTEAGFKEMKKWEGFHLFAPIYVIPCSVDLEVFNRSEKALEETNKLKAELNLENKKILIYSGSLGTWYLLKEMVDFFCRLLKNDERWHFVFLSRDLDLIDQLKFNFPKEVTNNISGFSVQRFSISQYLLMADWAIFFITPKYSKISSFPTKHAELMALGIPVIANSGVGDVKEIIEESKSGFVINEFSNEKYDEIIDSINEFNSSPEEIISFSKSNFSLQNANHIYSNIYNKVLNNE